MEADTDVCVCVCACQEPVFLVDIWDSLYAHTQASIYIGCLHMRALDGTATSAIENPTGRAGVHVYLHHMKPHRHVEGFVWSKGSFKDTMPLCPDAPDMCFTFRELVSCLGN